MSITQTEGSCFEDTDVLCV